MYNIYKMNRLINELGRRMSQLEDLSQCEHGHSVGWLEKQCKKMVGRISKLEQKLEERPKKSLRPIRRDCKHLFYDEAFTKIYYGSDYCPDCGKDLRE